MRNGIPLPTGDHVKKVREAMRERDCSFTIKPVKEEDVLKIIKDLKNSSATGVDCIDTRTIKLIADLIAPVLTHVVESMFIEIWKLDATLK